MDSLELSRCCRVPVPSEDPDKMGECICHALTVMVVFSLIFGTEITVKTEASSSSFSVLYFEVILLEIHFQPRSEIYSFEVQRCQIVPLC